MKVCLCEIEPGEVSSSCNGDADVSNVGQWVSCWNEVTVEWCQVGRNADAAICFGNGYEAVCPIRRAARFPYAVLCHVVYLLAHGVSDGDGYWACLLWCGLRTIT